MNKKQYQEILTPVPIKKIFNKIQGKKFPTQWKIAKILVLSRKGGRNQKLLAKQKKKKKHNYIISDAPPRSISVYVCLSQLSPLCLFQKNFGLRVNISLRAGPKPLDLWEPFISLSLSLSLSLSQSLSIYLSRPIQGKYISKALFSRFSPSIFLRSIAWHKNRELSPWVQVWLNDIGHTYRL